MRPRPLKREGEFNIAAKYMYRAFEPGIVKKVPTDGEIKAICEKFPGTKIKMLVAEGDNLEELLFQDAYSFEIADIYVGAKNELELDEKYNEIVAMLQIVIE
ncbi:MAG: hypothetical protein U9R69_01130 [Thermodesulfobacteriota bacterium]|nr:hypothetical protein [Thermodesulfobacteriota bacterium]